jgi:signal transduction histidine kinase
VSFEVSEQTDDHGEVVLNERLLELYDRMIGEVRIPDVLRDVADVVCQDLRAERATVYLIENETRELASVAVIGNVARSIRVPIRETSLAGYCAMTGRAFVVADAYGDLSGIDPKLRFDRTWDEINQFRTRDVMCAPATFKGRTLGVVQVVNSAGETFASRDLQSLRGIARMIGYALYHARLYDDIRSLKRLEKEKAEFMRIMVHELKSPVAAAKMMTDLLEEQTDVDEMVASLTGRVSDCMDRLLALIGDILDLARVKSGDPLGEIAVIDLVGRTRDGCEAYREQAEGKGLALTVELADAALPVRMDSKGFALILSNLVSNAVKYTPAGGVSVVLQPKDHWAVLTVSDTGMGIPQADIPKLFREFFRASNARRQRIQGSGVGLAGVKQIVERFGGQMEFDSRENEGSTFVVRLPIHEEAEEAPASAQ